MSTTAMSTPVPYRVAPDMWAGLSATIELTDTHSGYDAHLAGEHLGYIWVDRIDTTGETAWAAATPRGVEPHRTARADDLAAVLVFLVEARISRARGQRLEHPAETYLPLARYRCAHLRVLRTRANARRARSWRGAR